MKALLAQKIGMTQVFDDSGRAVPLTVLEVGPNVVTALRTGEKDGYTAYQLGYGTKKKPTKAEAGQLKNAKAHPKLRREVRGNHELTVGQTIEASIFAPGELVDVVATSKGKGFAGTIKRHNFSRGPVSHGSHNIRKPGSIGSMYPEHVRKGTKMAGRMGTDTVTVRNLIVYSVVPEERLLAVKGAVPGPNKTLVFIREAVKPSKRRATKAKKLAAALTPAEPAEEAPAAGAEPAAEASNE